MTIKLYQVFYESKQVLDKGCTPIDARNMNVIPLFENKHIIDTYPKFSGADYYGVTSWRMLEKTGLTKERIDNWVISHPSLDAYLYGQYGSEFSLLDNKSHATPIGLAWVRIFQLDLFKDKTINGDRWINCFCNYFIANKETWDRYMVYLNKLIWYFDNDPVLKWILTNQDFKHREGKKFPLQPFILEYLFGLFLADNPDIRYAKIPNKLGGQKPMNTLNDVYTNHKSPAGHGDKGTLHRYIETYDRLFSPFREQPITLLEIGVAEGESLNMWRQYFPKARIIGVDLKSPKHPVPNCEIGLADQGSKESLQRVLGTVEFDIIIDDGSHKIQHQLLSHKYLFPKLKKGGLYIIEDIQEPDIDMKTLQEFLGPCEIVDTRKISNRYDDILMIWKKS